MKKYNWGLQGRSWSRHLAKIAVRFMLLCSFVIGLSCAGWSDEELAQATDTAASSAAGSSDRLEIDWLKNSVEHRDAMRRLYDEARVRLRERAAGRDRGSWAVLIDLEVAILDNSPFFREVAESGAELSIDRYIEWLRREEAESMTGAAFFLRDVQSSGGEIIMVSSRGNSEQAEAILAASKANLDRNALNYDAAIRIEGVSAVGGAASADDLEVLVWLGDSGVNRPSIDRSLTLRDGATRHLMGAEYEVIPCPVFGNFRLPAAP